MKKNNNRNRRLAKNTLSGILYQLTAVICGFVLPKAILEKYGSDVNGLVNSIAQFLQVIAFLELGIGAVVQSALYKPISENENNKISEIVVAGNNFFKKIAYILVGYIIILLFVFPIFIDQKFGFTYDALLILAMSISYFAQYYFGVIDRLFLNAAQMGYIQNNINIITLIANTIGCYLLIYAGFSIQFIKLVTSVVFLIRPIIVRMYVNKHYSINRKAKYNSKSIQQKWNGVAQHVAAFVLDGTDILVLSLFLSLVDVSIYSVYNIVVAGLRQLFLVAFGGVMPLFGELWANQEKEILNKYFRKVDLVLHVAVILIWSCTYKLIVPFVMVYTENVHDVDYNVPIFAMLICIAGALCCLRITSNSMILAAGHYKQTQHIFIIAACINILLSVVLVSRLGLIGVIIGTVVAMLYQTIHMQYYCIRKLGIYSYKNLAKQLMVDIISILCTVFFTSKVQMIGVTWIAWIFLSMKVVSIMTCVVVIVNLLSYHKDILKLFKR